MNDRFRILAYVTTALLFTILLFTLLTWIETRKITAPTELVELRLDRAVRQYNILSTAANNMMGELRGLGDARVDSVLSKYVRREP